MTEQIKTIPLCDIVRFKSYYVGDLDGPAATIKQFGLPNLPTVRESKKQIGKYEAVTEILTVEAARQAGLDSIQCIVKELDDVDAIYLWFSSNHWLLEPDPIKKAEALQELLDKGQTQPQIAFKLKVSQSFVSQSLALLIQHLRDRSLTQSVAEVLLGLDPQTQIKLYDLAREGQWGERKLRSFKEKMLAMKKDDCCTQSSMSMTLAECTVKQFFKEILKLHIDKQVEHQCDNCKNRKLCGRIAKETDTQLNDEAETPKTEDKPKLIDIEEMMNQLETENTIQDANTVGVGKNASQV
jgi:ParB-like chromosome segregation protein Spo0J